VNALIHLLVAEEEDMVDLEEEDEEVVPEDHEHVTK